MFKSARGAPPSNSWPPRDPQSHGPKAHAPARWQIAGLPVLCPLKVRVTAASCHRDTAGYWMWYGTVQGHQRSFAWQSLLQAVGKEHPITRPKMYTRAAEPPYPINKSPLRRTPGVAKPSAEARGYICPGRADVPGSRVHGGVVQRAPEANPRQNNRQPFKNPSLNPSPK